ncbi:hydantoinase/oxoprolinase family protein [Rhodoligotrophos defluvii]|uniref:hydantoinase/oxoprolinase family protein n=1 Tax=Rhodoligotrophos defluvii TaxID=2561934 RepID=UPI0010C95479|nr:hydantoinase/oxoprolinase family protein [Rhodoligotrophos defluvii]
MAGDISLAVDIGGTFTDIVLRKGNDIFLEKTLTTHEDLLVGFFTGVDAAMARAGLQAGEMNGPIIHATTVVTNALIERTGAPTAMVFTRGFKDILRIRDERRYDMYDPQIEFPRPLVDADHTFTVNERIYADGTVGRAVDDAEIDMLCEELARLGIASVGVCLLHSYRNPTNERAVAAGIRKRLPEIHVSLSSDIAPQIREYLRASTTAANAYAVPITKPYLDKLERTLRARGFPSNALIMLSSGGVVAPSTAGRLPVRMIESGPAAGALGATHASKTLSFADIIAFDMGGTTAKVCLIRDAKPLVSGYFEIDRMYRFKEGSGLPVTVPCIDLIEIGAGGGSIASIDPLGLLKVGPRSAGSRPGPACYGRGGIDPTVTDANVVLGTIDAGNFLGGSMPLDADAAGRALESIAGPLRTDAIGAARGVYRLVCETMASAVRAHAAERGVDYRGVPMLAFGGAGPVHACEVASLLKSRTVIFPPLASVYSAFGSLVTPPRLDLVRSALQPLSEVDWDAVEKTFSELEDEGRDALREAGCPDASIRFRYAADLRYVGQHYDLLVELDQRPAGQDAAEHIRQRFHSDYVRRYRVTPDGVDVEVVNWRLTAIGSEDRVPEIKLTADARSGRVRMRKVHLWNDGEDVRVIARSELASLGRLQGPLIIEEAETTLVIPPDWCVQAGALGAVMANRLGQEQIQ